MIPFFSFGQRQLLRVLFVGFVVLQTGDAKSNENWSTDTRRLVDEFYLHLDGFSGVKNYEDAKAIGEQICEIGVNSKCIHIEARGLVRLAYIEILFGKWRNKWDEKLERALSLVEGTDSVAEAEYLIYSGYILGNWQSDFLKGHAKICEGLRIARLHRADDVMIIGCQFSSQLLNYLDRKEEGLTQAVKAVKIAETFGNSWLLKMSISNVLRNGVNSGNAKRFVPLAKRLNKLAGKRCHVAESILFYAGESDRQLEVFENKIEQLRSQEPKTHLEWLELGNQIYSLSSMYRNRDNHEKAIEIFGECIECYEKSNCPANAHAARCHLLLMHAAAMNFDYVHEHLEDLLEKSKKFKRGFSPSELATLYAKIGRAEDAVKWTNQILDVLEAVRGRNVDRAFNDANNFWDSELKTREFKDALAIKERIAQRNNKWFFAIAFLSITTILFALYRNHVLKGANQDLEKEVNDRTAELRQALETAELAVKSKSEFLARANHEVRSPLQAIIGYSELLQQSDSYDEKQKHEFLNGLSVSGQHLMSLVNDVIEVTKIEDGVLQINENHFNLYELAADVRCILNSSAECKNLSLSFDMDHCQDVWLFGDDTMLRQILINLVSNAIKFTDVGQVSVEVSTVPTHNNGCKVNIKVSDTGAGIPRELHGNLFQPFSDLQNRNVGKGLGLYITKSLVELLNGHISFESSTSSGTVFRLEIPFSTSQTQRVAQRNTIGFQQARVVVVDDKQIMRQLICDMLLQLGHDAQGAETLETALELIEEWQPDFVLLDLRMPGVSGFEFHEAIRAKFPERPQIIAMTGDATTEMRRKALDVGFDSFLSKPFLKAHLKKALLQSSHVST